MAYTIAFFGSKPYDEASFNEKNKEYWRCAAPATTM